MTIKYKYYGENEVIVPNANSYKIEDSQFITSHWQAMGTFYNVSSGETRVFASEIVETSNGGIIQEDYQAFNGITIGIQYRLDVGTETVRIYNTNYNALVPIDQQITPGVQVAVDNFFVPQVNQAFNFILSEIAERDDNSSFPWKYQDPFILVTSNVNITYWHPRYIVRQYTLKLFVSNTLIYSRTENFPPEYVEIIDQCPPNTCPVDCGTHICCYDNNGIAIYSFQN